jgi:hypothetical protein
MLTQKGSWSWYQTSRLAPVPLLVAFNLSAVAQHWHVTLVALLRYEANNGTSSEVDWMHSRTNMALQIIAMAQSTLGASSSRQEGLS